MTIAKTLGAIILSAALVTPALAQANTAHHGRIHELKNFRGVYNQLNTPYLNQDEVNVESGFGVRDSSRPGGFDPSFNPAGN